VLAEIRRPEQLRQADHLAPWRAAWRTNSSALARLWAGSVGMEIWGRPTRNGETACVFMERRSGFRLRLKLGLKLSSRCGHWSACRVGDLRGVVAAAHQWGGKDRADALGPGQIGQPGELIRGSDSGSPDDGPRTGPEYWPMVRMEHPAAARSAKTRSNCSRSHPARASGRSWCARPGRCP
jgi:hypothetical protein